MKNEDILIELNILIERIDALIDIMFVSTQQVMDLGNVNYELNNVLDKLDMITDSMEDSNEKSMLESAKYNVTYATLDIIDNVDIVDKINRLRLAKNTIIIIKTKLYTDGLD
jgi:division protein CdvB (Snf7/Vps24/ESCRT-III family)